MKILRSPQFHWALGPHVRSHEISDAQWDRIRKISGLPPEARSEIGRAIAWYRAGKTAFSRTPAATKEKLEQARKTAEKLRLILEKFVDASGLVDMPVHLALAGARTGWPGDVASDPLEATPHLLLGFQGHLRRTERWFEDGQKQIARGSSGAKLSATLIHGLVSDLDETLKQYAQKTISLSYKDGSIDYITAVCRLADPDIGGGSIKEAMEKRISDRLSGRAEELASLAAATRMR
jgi:hypothetical protein